MIRELSRSIGNTVMETVGRASSRVQERRPLPVDLLESEDAYLAVFDAPGATSGDVQVRFDENTLEVRIDRFRDFYDGFEMRVPGRGLSLDGHVRLPEGTSVDADSAEATLRRNGALEVRVPKDGPDREVSVTDEADREEHDERDAAGAGEDATDEAGDDKSSDEDA